MSRLLGRVRTSIRLAPRALLSVTRLRKDRRQIVEESVAATTSSATTAPAFTTGVLLASASSPGNAVARRGKGRISRSVTKDTLLFGLEALSESADAFGPLKSVVGGLLFFAKQADLVSGNKEQISDVYVQIDAMVASLARAIPDVTELSPVAKEAIRTLAEDIHAVCTDMEGVSRQRWSMRFIRARQHSDRLDSLVKRLNKADACFMRTIATSTEMKSTQILACVQPLREEVHRLLIQGRREFFF
ncbi:hypothetical protein PENSPDRAFT_651787, partial [Peniophora sp. CONT]